MPIYEFECNSCNIRKEEICSFKESELISHNARCKECGKGVLIKQISSSYFHLRGPDWTSRGR